MNFDGMDAFCAFLATRVAAVAVAEKHGLELAGRIIEAEARHEIGIPQPAAGPFGAWAALADSTVEEKDRLGYTGHLSAEDPLLRTGELRDSIHHFVEGETVFVGSESEVAVWQEQGTSKMPPRSFLGGAAVRKTDEAIDAIGAEVANAIAGGIRANSWK